MGDPDDAHRLIARFLRSKEEKSRSITVAVSDPSLASSASSSSAHSTHESAVLAGRAFLFPSMTRHSTLENSLEIGPSANETGREDPLAFKLGQIPARRAAATTRTISRGSRGGAGSRSTIQHISPTPSLDLVPTHPLSPLPPRLRHSSDESDSDEVVFRGNSSSALPSPANRRRSRVRRSHMRVNSDGLVRRTMSEGVRSQRASEGGGQRLSEVRRTGQAFMRRAQTGNGDGGEVSSDGREVVLFMPRAPPPPVPRVPAPPAAEAPTLRATKAPTPPAIKVPTPPAVVVDPPVGVRAAPVAPPLVRESIPLPEASPYPGAAQLGPPGVLVQSEEPTPNIVDEPRGEPIEPVLVQFSGPVRGPPFDSLHGSIVEPPAQRRTYTFPWSPPDRVLSREGSFHPAPDGSSEADTDAEFPSGVSVWIQGVSYLDEGRARYTSTPVHEEVESPMLSAEDDTMPRQDIPERATITSAMRGHVTQPAIVTRQSSREFVRLPGAIPSPPRSGTPARRTGGRTEGALMGGLRWGFPAAPVPSPVPSLPSSGSSRIHAHAVSIPMRHDDHSPPRPEQLSRSVSPHTEVSPLEEDSSQSAHTADNVLRLPLDDWLEFAMSSMAAMGIPLTRSTLEDLHESEDEGAAVVSEALSTSSMYGFQEDESNGGLLDGVSQAADDSGGDSPSLSLSPVSETPSPARNGLFSTTGYGGMTTFTTALPESTGTRPTIRPTDLRYSTNNPTNLSAISGISASTEEFESDRAVGGLQDIAVVVRELNPRTPIPSESSSHAPPSAFVPLPMHTAFSSTRSHVDPPSFVGPPPITSAYHAENILETKSPANETGREDSLALKTGRILATRDAAAAHTVSGGIRGSAGSSSSKVGYGAAILVDLGQTVIISSSMPSDEIIQHLTEHGCADLTPKLNPISPNTQPMAYGGFSSVYREKLRDGRQVAIKALRVSLDADDEVDKIPKRAARELYTWSKCQHPNVLPLLGLAKVQDQIRMISLWMENGSLPSYLNKHPDLSRCDMSMHVCKGLVYLHRAGVVHGDLKGNNVLVSSEGIPLITDFGNAVLQQSTLLFTETVKQNAFTARWTAPEILEDKEKQSKEADVFALGMTVLEIITGKVPYFYTNNIGAIVTAIVAKKEPPKRPEEHIPSNSQHGDALWSLLLSCWEYEPEKRPSAAKVVEIMKGITHEGLTHVQAESEAPAEAEVASAAEYTVAYEIGVAI